MSIETTGLYRQMKRRLREIPAGPPRLLDEFERLRAIVKEQGKYIVLLFPEYTPHDHTRHLDHLFSLADRILGKHFYKQLKPSELVLLAFALYAHDWGMAVSEAERTSLENGREANSFALIPNEPTAARDSISEATLAGISPEVAWREYLRRTHGLRSGARLRQYLEPLGAVFAGAVAKIAEGHTLDVREVRDPDRYPLALPVFGETVNLAALTTYVRMVDLLDIGEDRTPYALWKFVAPADPVSKIEWQKHRALSPAAVAQGSALREVVISGRTDDSTVFAALADLRSWIVEQFAMSIAQLRIISGKYDLDLDSRIVWNVEAVGFEPLAVRFELERSQVLGLLSKELYEDDPLAFVRELLQNSVDAIDMRAAFLSNHGVTLNGEIHIRVSSRSSGLRIDWTDNGIGMDIEVLTSYFARLGLTWYQSRDARRLGHIEAISQFGVGILSCFAVSQKLLVQTRKEPQAGGSRLALSIEIPKRESHFRIRTTTSAPVGTKIRLEVNPSLAAIVSGEAVRDALIRTARYIRHKVIVDFDGVITEVRSLARKNTLDDEHDDLKITVVGMRGDSAEKLEGLTNKIVFEFGSASGKYHGYYSAMIPKRPDKVSESGGYRVWRLETELVDFNDVLVKTERALFVKGIQTGSVRPQRPHGAVSQLALGRHTNWINPTVLLNVRQPSDVEFNLARSSAHIESVDWLDDAWREIATKLRVKAFSWASPSATRKALVLGSCAVFGGIPDSGLDALVEESEIPLLVLRSREGLIWISLAEFLRKEEFLEAPFELSYANGGELRGFGTSSGVQGWGGVDALFPAGVFSKLVPSKRFPWLGPVLGFGYRRLMLLGWSPVELSTVQAPKDQLPLLCRVWRKLTPEADPAMSESWGVLRRLYDDAPEVLRFPPSISEYAAFGSRYWNIDHPKIIRLVTTLTLLAERVRQKRLSSDRLKVVSYLISNAFQGYIVSSRRSAATLALEVPNRLLAVAKEEGLAEAEALDPGDFFPGTINGYENPYHYDLNMWKTSVTGLGRPWGINQAQRKRRNLKSTS
jgi:hypothetical protein